jgi:hypothetical protein
MITQQQIRLTKLALALSVALAASPSFAQNTTSAVSGRISNVSGQPASGAQVQIVHTESGSVSNVVTDAEGRYVARGLRVGGPYTITVTKDGITETRRDVFLELAQTAEVDATLGVQTVTIAGAASRSEVFSGNNMGAGTAINNTQLLTQASISRSLQDYARADPRVSQTDKDRGEISVAGQNSRYNSMTIDGVAINDTFGLEASGSPTARQPISIEAIQSVQVNVANYDVTQKGYTGANINAVTKSGTNTYRGGVYYVFRNDTMSGDRYNPITDVYSDAPKSKETTKGVWASGPLIEDKLFIYALAENFESSRSSPEFGPIGSGAGTTVGITQSAIAEAQRIAQSRYGADIGTPAVPTGSMLTSKERMVKFDWNITDEHRANLRYAKTEQGEPFYPGFGNSSVGLSSSFYNQGKSIETAVAQVFSDWTPNFSTEFKFSTRDYESVPVNTTQMPSIALQFSGPLPAGAPSGLSTGNRNLNFGTEFSRHNNVLRNDTKDLYAGANWIVGDHELKFGVDQTKNKVYNAFLQGIFGSYTFGCLQSNDTNFYSFGALPSCANATNAQIERAVLENFQNGRPLNYSVQRALPGNSLDNAIAQFETKNTGLFLQDTWNVNDQLTLTYGVRYDRNDVGGRPLANAAAAQPLVAGNAATGARQSGGFGLDNTQTIDGTDLVQPRFGFNYRFDKSPRPTQLRGGFGLFQGAAATVWMSNPFSNPGVATATISCSATTTPACPTTGGLTSLDPNAQPNVASAIPAANVDFIDPAFRQPSIWKTNLAFDTELPWYGLVFSGEALYTKNKNGIYYENLNIGAATRTGSDGRQLFWNAAGLNPANYSVSNNAANVISGRGTSTRALNNRSFGNALVARDTDKGDAKVLTMSLSQPMTKGFGWSVAYTYTDATEVSPLTSSTSSSNFGGRSVFNPNEEVAATSSYAIKNRVNALLNFQKKFLDNYNTRFGLFYEGREGRPYSWTYNNDMNGDGLIANDLMYIPTAFGSNEVAFAGDTATNRANEQRFWDVVNANKGLSKAAGGVVSRNNSTSEWVNTFDVRISQEIPGIFARNKATFTLDFMNFGNLLNKKWGRTEEVGFNSGSGVGGGQARSFVDVTGIDAQGRYVYVVRNDVERQDLKQAKGESQWAIQATLRYEF